MTQKALLVDVAQAANVSVATVSRVVQNKGYVAVKTRARVEAAIQATGYRVNAVAQGLRSQRTYTIGHLLQSIAPNPFFANVALGVEQEARNNGYSVLMFNVNGNPQHEAEGLERLMERRVDAVIFTTAVDYRNVANATEYGLPVVQVERVTSVRSHSVVIDNCVGAVQATTHLLELGHRNIGFVGVNPTPPRRNKHRAGVGQVEAERLSGFEKVLKQHGLLSRGNIVLVSDYCSPAQTAPDTAEAYAATRKLLALPERPTALLVTCDVLAAGALQAIYDARLRVPDDISIVGFDNTLAAYLTPPLTTVAQPMFEIGVNAAHIAIQALQEDVENASIRSVSLATSLVIRCSTGPSPIQIATL